MQLFEWGIASKPAGEAEWRPAGGPGLYSLRRGPGSHPVGITGSAPGAQARMLEALDAVPAGILARGWVTALALAADRLTYDRLDTLVRVTRDADGTVRWLAGDSLPDGAARAAGGLADSGRLPLRLIDGQRLRALRRARGLSQERLAWVAGVDMNTVARLERHPRPQCRGLTLALLAEALGENPRALVSAALPDRG
jgi:DNA-binding XRE family transcriptional regulator